MKDLELTQEEIQEMENEIRVQMKLLVRGIEILWEELQKSNLPESIKMKILESHQNKGE